MNLLFLEDGGLPLVDTVGLYEWTKGQEEQHVWILLDITITNVD
jgi:hypothetical protein